MPHPVPPNTSSITGLVLAGGQSTRLGQDKVSLSYQGETLLERTARLLGSCCTQVLVSCRNPQIVPPHLQPIVDTTKRVGPLGGIITALRHLNGPVLALACDLPFMEKSFLTQLITARSLSSFSSLVTIWQERGSGLLQPLVAIYEPEILPILESSLDAGNFRLHQIVPTAMRHALLYEPEQRHFFFNVNYPRDLKKLRSSPERRP